MSWAGTGNCGHSEVIAVASLIPNILGSMQQLILCFLCCKDITSPDRHWHRRDTVSAGPHLHVRVALQSLHANRGSQTAACPGVCTLNPSLCVLSKEFTTVYSPTVRSVSEGACQAEKHLLCVRLLFAASYLSSKLCDAAMNRLAVSIFCTLNGQGMIGKCCWEGSALQMEPRTKNTNF